MSDLAGAPPTAVPARARVEPGPIPQALFVLAAFFSAALVFVVEPMIARLVLPLLGGSPAVWNTSLAFFQIALLAGYAYAHLLQRIGRVRVQIGVHLGVLLLAAALALPLRVTGFFGDPPPGAPALWLVAVLAVSIGAPFAALSATAPLVQAWHARAVRHEGARAPWGLYAASNLGSLIALVAYPVLIEPNVTLRTQTLGWSVGYGAFVAVAAILGTAVWRSVGSGQDAPAATTLPLPPTAWTRRLTWLALAALPSSLMLGVTTYVTTDLGSAPFLWVAPLGLYLVTFIIAFQDRPAIPPGVARGLQALSVALCAVFIHSWTLGFVQELAIHLTAFFFTALICHQALVARRPEQGRLTEFYIWMSLGGVVGGAFNAFVAPLIFTTVIEYPAVLVLACLAQPWGRGRLAIGDWMLLGLGVAAALLALGLGGPLRDVASPLLRALPGGLAITALLAVTANCAFFLRRRGLVFAGLIGVLVFASEQLSAQPNTLHVWRSFFGVMRVYHLPSGGLGDVHVLTHGTTTHGAQGSSPALRCLPLTYYAPQGPIGQVIGTVQATRPAVAIGAVGLGAGSVAAYTRPADSIRFFEIDPLVLKIARDPANFTYLTQCARGRVAFTLGDARLTLGRMPAAAYDVLLIDAFTSDSVPAHLLTVEALKMYLGKLRPGGVIILHLSNRNLDLVRPAEAVALVAGGAALEQDFTPSPTQARFFWVSGERVVIVGRTRADLAPFLADPRWTAPDPGAVRPWTDDYTNLFGALVRRSEERWRGR